jgi:hypothetical protein
MLAIFCPSHLGLAHFLSLFSTEKSGLHNYDSFFMPAKKNGLEPIDELPKWPKKFFGHFFHTGANLVFHHFFSLGQKLFFWTKFFSNKFIVLNAEGTVIQTCAYMYLACLN